VQGALSDEVLEEVEWFVLTLLPSWRWLSPIHLWKYEPARQRLIAALVHCATPSFGQTDSLLAPLQKNEFEHPEEIIHHAVAAFTLYDFVFTRIPSLEKEVRAASGSPAGYNVIDAFAGVSRY
jgi:hypothetical protein